MKKYIAFCFVIISFPFLSFADDGITTPEPTYEGEFIVGSETTLFIHRTEDSQLLKINGPLNFLDSDFSHYVNAIRNLHLSIPLVVELNSGGGDIRSIQRLRDDLINLCGSGKNGCTIKTIVREDATCSSGCVHIFAVGKEREASTKARFVFHSSYSDLVGFHSVPNQIASAHLANNIPIGILVQLFKDHGLYADGRDVGISTKTLHDYGLVTKITEEPGRPRKSSSNVEEPEQPEPALTADKIDSMKSIEQNRLVAVTHTRLAALRQTRNISVYPISSRNFGDLSFGTYVTRYLRIIRILESLPPFSGSNAPINRLAVDISGKHQQIGPMLEIKSQYMEITIPSDLPEENLAVFLNEEVIAFFNDTTNEEWVSAYMQTLNVKPADNTGQYNPAEHTGQDKPVEHTGQDKPDWNTLGKEEL